MTHASDNHLVSVVGMGQDPFRHLTLEGLRTLQAANKVLLINGNSAAAREVIGDRQLVEDISALYRDGDIDDHNYKRVVAKVIEASLVYPHVAVCVAGHPLLGVSWWERLQASPIFCGKLQYIEGISSWTSIFTKLGVDPLESGSVVVDANRLMLFEYDLNPELDLYIFNICSTGTRRAYLSDPSKENRIADLGRHLARFYGEDHPVYLVSAGSDFDDWLKIATVATIESILSDIHFSSSLFLPSLSPQRCNMQFLRQMLASSGDI